MEESHTGKASHKIYASGKLVESFDKALGYPLLKVGLEGASFEVTVSGPELENIDITFTGNLCPIGVAIVRTNVYLIFRITTIFIAHWNE